MKVALVQDFDRACGGGIASACASAIALTRARSSTRSSPARSSPDVDNKASVEKLLGRPTLQRGNSRPTTGIIVSRDTNQLAFRNPRATRQTVMLIRFDQAGNVASIQKTGKEFVMSLDPSKRFTPTLGRSKSFFDELFGNIGTVGAPGAGTPQ